MTGKNVVIIMLKPVHKPMLRLFSTQIDCILHYFNKNDISNFLLPINKFRELELNTFSNRKECYKYTCEIFSNIKNDVWTVNTLLLLSFGVCLVENSFHSLKICRLWGWHTPWELLWGRFAQPKDSRDVTNHCRQLTLSQQVRQN